MNRNSNIKTEIKKIDRFVHEIQKQKMNELWDNEYDSIWEACQNYFM